MKVYGIKSCGSVKNAFAFFKEHGIAYEFVDLKKEPQEREKIDSWLSKAPIETLFNTKGTTYRTLKLKELNLDNTQKAEWLAKENMLIKRPVIEFEEEVIIGFDANLYKEKFL